MIEVEEEEAVVASAVIVEAAVASPVVEIEVEEEAPVEVAEAETVVEEEAPVEVAVLVLEPVLKSSSKLTRDSPEFTFNVELMIPS